jgi:hypothetical protein
MCKDIMPSNLWSTKRVSLNSDWTQIDLTPYKDQLSNLGPIVVGIVEDDSVGTYFAMDNKRMEKIILMLIIIMVVAVRSTTKF